MKIRHSQWMAGVVLSAATGVLAGPRVAMLQISSDDDNAASEQNAAMLSTILQSDLTNLPDVQWVERTEVESLEREMDLARSGLTAADTIRLGRMLRADMVLRGSFVTQGENRALVLEVIDLLRAQELASCTIPCAMNIYRPANIGSQDLHDVIQKTRALLTDALKERQESAHHKNIGMLFIRNISSNNRLDHLEHVLDDALGGEVNKMPGLRWLRFARTAESLGEAQLALRGLLAVGNSQWTSPADAFIWGTIEEKSDYTGPSEKVPFTLTLYMFDGSSEIRQIRQPTTADTWRNDLRMLATKLADFSRTLQPVFDNAVRDAIAQQLKQQAYRISPNRMRTDAASTSADIASLRYASKLLDLVCFFKPDDLMAQEDAIHCRMRLGYYDRRMYSGQYQLIREWITHIDAHKAADSRRSQTYDPTSEFSQVLLAANQFLCISQNIPSARGRNMGESTDPAIAEERVIQMLERLAADKADGIAKSQYAVQGMEDILFATATTVLNSRAAPATRMAFIQKIWPCIAALYTKYPDHVDRPESRRFRAAMLDVFDRAGQLAQARGMLDAQQIQAGKRIITLKVTPADAIKSPMPPARERTARETLDRTQPAVQEAVALVPQLPLLQPALEFHPRLTSYFSCSDLDRQDVDRQMTAVYYPKTRSRGVSTSGDLSLLGVVGDALLWSSYPGGFSGESGAFEYRPATGRTTRMPLPEKALLRGVLTLRQRMYLATSEGLIVRDPASGDRLFAGPQGLATTSLDAISGDENGILLIGHDRKPQGRLIRFDPVTEKFEDLAVNVGASSLQRWQNFCVLRNPHEYVIFNCATREGISLAAALAQAGVQLKDEMAIRAMRVVGWNSLGLWVFVGDRLLCLSHDRKSIAADLTLENITPSGITLSEDGRYAFLIVFAKVPPTVRIQRACYLMAADLVDKRWVAQYALPVSAEKVVCAANRVWLFGDAIKLVTAIHMESLGLKAGPALAITDTAQDGSRLATAAYNGDPQAIRDALRTDKGPSDRLWDKSDSAYDAIVRFAPENGIREMLAASPGRKLPADTAYWAARRNMPELITMLAAAKVDISTPEPDSRYTPLCAAIQHGYTKAFDALIAAGVDVNTAEQHQLRPLHMAILFRRPEMTARLLKAGADPSAKSMGLTPVHLAVLSQNISILQQLLDHRADINALSELYLNNNHHAQTPLMLAAARGDTAIASMLINKRADVNAVSSYGESAYSLAELADDQPMMDLLKSAGGTMPDKSRRFLQNRLARAIYSDNVEKVRAIITLGADVNMPLPDDVMPIISATQSRRDDILMELLRCGARPDVLVAPGPNAALQKVDEFPQRRIAIAQARMAGVATTQASIYETSPHLPKLLTLEEAMDVGDDRAAEDAIVRMKELPETPDGQWPLLHRITARGMPRALGALLARILDPDILGPEDVTPLMIAAGRNDDASVQILLKAGAQTQLVNKAGQNAWQIAQKSGAIRTAQLLKNAEYTYVRGMMDAVIGYRRSILLTLLENQSANLQDINGLTPLMVACRHNGTQMIALLLENKADPNMRDISGRTALHWLAISKNNYDQQAVVELLKKAGADFGIKDNFGKTALQYAIERKNGSVENAIKMPQD